MTRKFYRVALILIALGAFVSAPMLNAQPSPAGNVRDAIENAKKAVDHGKQGHVSALLTSAEAALQSALKAREAPHVDAGIGELKQAIEHGKAGHADVATKHAEQAVTHLSETYRGR